jgi:hypothetical protein
LSCGFLQITYFYFFSFFTGKKKIWNKQHRSLTDRFVRTEAYFISDMPRFI